MSKVSNIFANITSPKLSYAARESKEVMRKYSENVFSSKTLHEMLSDSFEYKGGRPDTVLVKDLKTGAPVEVKVLIEQYYKPNSGNLLEEVYSLLDNYGKKIGEKLFYTKKMSDGKHQMFAGDMKNYKNNLGGVGVRLDQLQIERALQLGIDVIPRKAEPKAMFYHTKMGFLPIERRLVEINNADEIKKIAQNELKDCSKGLNSEKIEPIVIQKNGKFYLDINKTIANANLQECKNLICRYNSYRVLSLESTGAHLELSGKELEHWKELLKNRSVFNKLSQRIINP